MAASCSSSLARCSGGRLSGAPDQPIHSPPDCSWGPASPVASPPVLRCTSTAPSAVRTVMGNRLATIRSRAILQSSLPASSLPRPALVVPVDIRELPAGVDLDVLDCRFLRDPDRGALGATQPDRHRYGEAVSVAVG